MRTTLKVSLLALLFAPAANAQHPAFAGVAPVLEAGVGYSFVDASVPSQSGLAMNGVQAIFNGDVSRRFGVKLDLGYTRSFNAFGTGHTADLLTYLAGPVFYPVRKRDTNVYTHFLMGGARETGVNFQSGGPPVLGFVNKFAWAGGAGIQYRLSRSFSVRVGADYLHSTFFNSTNTLQGQANIRTSVSMIYTFGANRE
jgi:opacity protein-like surface antigen